MNCLLNAGIYSFDSVNLWFHLYLVTATTVTADLTTFVSYLTIFFALPGIRTKTDHLQGNLVAVV